MVLHVLLLVKEVGGAAGSAAKPRLSNGWGKGGGRGGGERKGGMDALGMRCVARQPEASPQDAGRQGG